MPETSVRAVSFKDASDEDEEAVEIAAKSRSPIAPEEDSSKQQSDDEEPCSSTYFGKLLPDSYRIHEIRFAVGVGNLLSFNAGYLNGCCLSGLISTDDASELGPKVSVAGFTGAYTNSALSLSQFDGETFLFLVAMIFSMMAGAALSGAMTPRATPFRVEPSYGPTFLIGACLLMAGGFMAAYEVGDRYFFCFVAAANGTQNGVTSLFSANLIRTTHLTGTTTDLGLFLGQFARGNMQNLWKFGVLWTLATTFWLGGIVAYNVAYYFLLYSLLFSVVLHFIIGVLTIIFVVYELHVSIPAAIFGSWVWDNVLDELADHLVAESSEGENPETTRSLRRSQAMQSTRLRAFFDDIANDVDEIDASTIFEEFTKRGIKINRRDAEIMVKTGDTDGDGTMDREEFVQMAKTTHEKKLKKKASSIAENK